jgi:hypothetical protein
MWIWMGPYNGECQNRPRAAIIAVQSIMRGDAGDLLSIARAEVGAEK